MELLVFYLLQGSLALSELLTKALWSYLFYRTLTQGKTQKRWHSLSFHLSRMRGMSRKVYLSCVLLYNIAFMIAAWEILAGLSQSPGSSGSPLDRGSLLPFSQTRWLVFLSKTMRRSFETHPSELQLQHATNLQRIHSESGVECSRVEAWGRRAVRWPLCTANLG